MRLISIILAILFSATFGTAHAACTTAAPVSIPQFGPILPGGGVQAYYCAAAPAAASLGDLSPSEWAKRVQVCTTNCNYEPMAPGDPHSMLIATGCGASGGRSTAYLVEPPKPSSNRTALTGSCQSLLPAKGSASAPSPSPPPAHRSR